jgi:hypothetical protein
MNKLLIIFLSISFSSFSQMRWKHLKDIPHTWVMVERDSAGYLVYKPCNGRTPLINIDGDSLGVYWQLEESKFFINKFALNGNESFSIRAADSRGTIEFIVEIKNAKQKLVLWTFGDYKWVMTPVELKDKFRQVNNPCPTEMKREKEFLPVEF